MSNGATVIHKPPSNTALRAVIIVQGALTLWLAFVFLPLGIIAMLVNAVLAFSSQGVIRRLFAGFAIAAGIICAVVGLGLIAVSPAGMTELVQVR